MGGNIGSVNIDKLTSMEAQVAANQRLMQEMEKSWEQKLAEALAKSQKQKEEDEEGLVISAKSSSTSKFAHFLNLNEDPSLSESIAYIFKDGTTTIGRKDKDASSPDIVLYGSTIQKLHCKLIVCENVTLHPLPDAKVLLNGAVINSAVVLNTGDRIILGNNYVFRFIDHRNIPLDSISSIQYMNYNDALFEAQNSLQNNLSESMAEKSFALDKETLEKQAQMEAKLQELQQQVELEPKKARDALEIQSKLLASGALTEKDTLQILQKSRSLEEELKAQQEASKTLMLKQQKRKRQLGMLQSSLTSIAPAINEANSISKEMGKNVLFEIKLSATNRDGALNEEKDISHSRPSSASAKKVASEISTESNNIKVVIRVSDQNTGSVWMWSTEKFENRLFIIRDIYRSYLENEYVQLSNSEDPFWDPPEPSEIGTCFIFTTALTKLVEISKAHPINSIGNDDNQDSKLNFSIYPLDEYSNEPLDYLELDDDPFDVLIGKTIVFDIEVGRGENFPERFSYNTYATFSFFGSTYETNVID